jgi:two-component system NtrC family sensor kinase
MGPKLGLRVKFFLYSNTVIVVTMMMVSVIWALYEQGTRRDALIRRGLSITEAMAIPITDALMYEDLGLVAETGLIESHIDELLARNEDFMRGVTVLDVTGRVIHTSQWALLGRRPMPLDELPEIGDDAEVVSLTAADGERRFEVRTPLNISTRRWGTLIVTFSLAPVQDRVHEVARRAVMVAAVLMLFNSVLTALYVETLIRPILELNRVMRRIGRGDLSVRAVVPPSGDEVAELTEAFNGMLEEWEQLRRREQIQREHLAHTEKMAAVGTLAAGVAHEVNNPLAGIQACIENMRDSPDDVEMRERYVELIRDGLSRIARTVSNLLDFARPRRMRFEPTSLNHSLTHVVELVGYQLRKAGVEVETDLDSSGAVVEADHFQMEQLFLNLCLNALKAMPEGGTLTLSTRRTGDQVVAEIGDTGTGIPEAIRKRIFDPFFTTRDVGEGTGLGLAVSDAIVTAHRGTIEVASEMGEGSVFRVIFDAVDLEPDEEAT